MNNPYTTDNRIIIRCKSCSNKLRVPLDKGRLSISCPVCKHEFFYNPDSIIHTLIQIFVSLKAWLHKSSRNKLIFFSIVLAVIVALYLAFVAPSSREDTNNLPQNTNPSTQQAYVFNGTKCKNA